MAATLFCFAWIAALSWFAVRRKRGQSDNVLRRTDKHEAYLAFAMEILHQPKLTSLMLQQGTVTPDGLRATRQTLGDLNEQGLRAIVARALDDRIVRRAVAGYMARVHGVDRGRFMRLMGENVVQVRA
jgi:hypothetical protein